MILRNSTTAVGSNQRLQIVDLGLEMAAGIGLGDLLATLHPFKDHRAGQNITILMNSALPAHKGLMGHDSETAGIVDECISGNTGGKDSVAIGILYRGNAVGRHQNRAIEQSKFPVLLMPCIAIVPVKMRIFFQFRLKQSVLCLT